MIEPVFRSADRRWIIALIDDPENKGAIRIRTASEPNGDWRLLARRKMPPLPVFAPCGFGATRDGNWILFHDRDTGGGNGLYRVSTAGGEPDRLGDYPTSEWSSALSISADGLKFLLMVPRPPGQPEYWVLENYLPAAPVPAKAKPTAKAK